MKISVSKFNWKIDIQVYLLSVAAHTEVTAAWLQQRLHASEPEAVISSQKQQQSKAYCLSCIT